MWNSWIDECTSTNDLIKSAAKDDLPSGTWIAAHKQSAGRGRHQRQWHSLSGNLHLSILLRDVSASFASLVPLAVGVEVAEYLSHFPIQLKWPNDLLIGEKKVGGILCEGSIRSENESYIIVGIGLNCTSRPSDPSISSTSLSNWTSEKIQYEPWAAEIACAVARIPSRLERGAGIQYVDQFMSRAWKLPGERVTWRDIGGDSQEHSGVLKGIAADGALEVIVGNQVKRLYSEEIQLGGSAKSL